MDVKYRSYFKDEAADHRYFEAWVQRLETQNQRKYERYVLRTSLGKTHVWGLHSQESIRDTLVIFPGARTSALFWDLDRGLDHLQHPLKIYMVETNGLPNLSEGGTPDIKSPGYGQWAAEVLEALGIEKAYVAGASFGGLICMKLALVKANLIEAAFLLNPGCLQGFSLRPKNLYYNLLPLFRTSEKNIKKFLDKAVFAKPNHQLSPEAERLLLEYEVFAIRHYQDNTQKPYAMGSELDAVAVDIYLLEGDKDLLFPYEKSIANAQKHLRQLKEIQVFNQVGHGIETYAPAIEYIGSRMKELCNAIL